MHLRNFSFSEGKNIITAETPLFYRGSSARFAMSRIGRVFLISAATSLFTVSAVSQDSPSLGDVARQARKQKQQSQDAQTKATQSSKPTKVITDEEIPEHSEAAAKSSTQDDVSRGDAPSSSTSGGVKIPAEQWKSQIAAQKNAVASLQNSIDKMNDSIHFAPGNCVSGCVQWNERQKEKQQEVERGQAQLAEQKKRLEDLQESARRQGYGSSVYDP